MQATQLYCLLCFDSCLLAGDPAGSVSSQMIRRPGDELHHSSSGSSASDVVSMEQQPSARKSARKGSTAAEILEAAAAAAEAAPMATSLWPGAHPDQQAPPAPCEAPPHVLAIFQEDMADIMAAATGSLKQIEDALTARATGSPAASAARAHSSNPDRIAEPLAAAGAEAAGWGPLSGSGGLRLYGPPHAAARAAERQGSLCLRGGGSSGRDASAALAPEAAAAHRPAKSGAAAAASGLPVGGTRGAAAMVSHAAATTGTARAETSAAAVAAVTKSAAPASVADDTGRSGARQDGRDRKTKRNAGEPDKAQPEEDTDPAPPAKKMAGPRFAAK